MGSNVETSTIFYLALVAAALAADHLVFWHRFTEGAKFHPVRARRTLWQSWIAMLWLLAGTAIVLWAHGARPWSLLRLQIPTGWRLLVSAVLVLAVIALYFPTIYKLRHASVERKAALRTRLESHAGMLPHTNADLLWFIALAITAGICEELVFRGYLLWAIESALGLWPAVIISCVVFALAHAYLGISGVIKTGLIGAFFMASILVVRSLVPAMIAHALVDIGQGTVAWLILRASVSPHVVTDQNPLPSAEMKT